MEDKDKQPVAKRADEGPLPRLVWLEPIGWADPDNLTFDLMIEVEAERNGS